MKKVYKDGLKNRRKSNYIWSNSFMNQNKKNMTENTQQGFIPAKSEALKALFNLGLNRHIINHVLAVSRKATYIATLISSRTIDLRLVKIGALLHDIGRSKTHELDHAIVGGQIIREELNWSDKLARIAETHILGGLSKEEALKIGLPPKDYLPKTIEEKIVCLSDKYFIGSNEVSIEGRFENWFNRYGQTELLLTAKKRVEQLETEIYRLMYL
ncbi:MAG: HDIG domain-containing protein [Candidatus Lokiarchaeota archaeon]|nr:HDIG domain-containing protein [Candidatus Lokiarchaeota archaeon]